MNLAALETVIRENELSPVKRDKIIKKLRKRDKQGRLEFDLKDPQWVWRLCSANLMNGDLSFTGYEFRSKWALDFHYRGWKYPKWSGGNNRCLVVAEQGIGDEILFSSVFREFLAECPDAVIECDSRLKPIFEHNFDGEFISRWYDNPIGEPRLLDEYVEEYDSFVPMGDLFRCFRQGIKPDGKAWLKPIKKGDSGKIGLSWMGGRSKIDPEYLRCDNAVSLQYDKKDGKIVGADCPDWMENPHLDHNNMVEIFNLVSGLKEVRSVYSYMCHVAGSLGIPVTAIKPPYQEMTELGTGNNRFKWVYGTGQGKWKSMWYNSMTVVENWRQL